MGLNLKQRDKNWLIEIHECWGFKTREEMLLVCDFFWSNKIDFAIKYDSSGCLYVMDVQTVYSVDDFDMFNMVVNTLLVMKNKFGQLKNRRELL